MKPCNCKDQYSVDKNLRESGITYNDRSIMVEPTAVVLTVGSCKLKIPMNTFKAFAEWYLEDQGDYAKAKC